MKKLLLLITCFAFIQISLAQTQDKKWNIGLHGGLTQYRGELGNDFYKYDMAFYSFGGISVSRYMGNHFDLNMFITKGKFGYNRANGYFNNNFSSAILNLRFNVLADKYPVRPYLIIGGGAILYDKNVDIRVSKVAYVAPSFGGGVNFKISPSVMINLQETFLYSTRDNKSGAYTPTGTTAAGPVGNENNMYVLHSLGVTFNFGKKKDADLDGVLDRSDKCPNTPKNIAVDKSGCPFDIDGDGVADYLDKCSNTPKDVTVDKLGCPIDTDGDGVADYLDKCANTPKDATVDKLGCPIDTDGDGVADYLDKCSNTPKNVSVDKSGCPMDTDGDGVADYIDKCPNTPKNATVDKTGCTLDTDGDGVADYLDKCPTVKGTTANNGCPEMKKEDAKKITEIASKIFFETNSDVLKVASLNSLDELVKILLKYEGANLVIEGYTDSQGEDAFNLTLSQKRTESVKKYLMEKGIRESRLTSIGYGETKPVADNNTSAGRAKNRRVELKTSY